MKYQITCFRIAPDKLSTLVLLNTNILNLLDLAGEEGWSFDEMSIEVDRNLWVILHCAMIKSRPLQILSGKDITRLIMMIKLESLQ